MRRLKKGGGEVELGWVKSYISILSNEAADVQAKQAAEEVPLNDHEVLGSGHAEEERER